MARRTRTVDQRAYEDFATARRKAFWNEVMSFLSGRPNRLLSWQEVHDKLGVRGQVYRGVQAVPLSKIIGSVGRYRDFDRAFLPKQDQLAERWSSIARAYYDDVDLPPVKLYKIGDAYFVLDGNHRVSVARERNMEFIDAEVIEAQVRVPVGPELDADDLEIKGEYAEFLERTRMDELLPHVQIEFTSAGGYKRLLEHIAVHRYFMGLEKGRPISEDEAVLGWYYDLYKPLTTIIREKGILADFPGRTEADLYLWIMDHQHFLRERFGPVVSMEQAADHFAEHYTTRPIKRLLHAVQDLVTGQRDAEELGLPDITETPTSSDTEEEGNGITNHSTQ